MRVVIADDAVILREGAVRLLEEAGFEVVAQAGDAEDLLRKVRAHFDVAVIDVRMPPDNTDDGRRAHPPRRAAGRGAPAPLAVRGGALSRRTAGAGSRGVGYLLKDRVAEVEVLTDAVRRVGEAARCSTRTSWPGWSVAARRRARSRTSAA